MKVALHWFRRDLRLSDNTALQAALKTEETVIPLFILDREEVKSSKIGAPKVAFLLASLQSLQVDLEAAGSELVFRQGPVEEKLKEIIQETGAEAVFYNRQYEPLTRKRDEKVEKLLHFIGIEVHTSKDDVLFEPHEILKETGTPYKVFTPYEKSWRSRIITTPLSKAKFTGLGTKYPKKCAIPHLKELGFNSVIYPIYPDEKQRKNY